MKIIVSHHLSKRASIIVGPLVFTLILLTLVASVFWIIMAWLHIRDPHLLSVGIALVFACFMPLALLVLIGLSDLLGSRRGPAEKTEKTTGKGVEDEKP